MVTRIRQDEAVVGDVQKFGMKFPMCRRSRERL
jgi:hypothetical protein